MELINEGATMDERSSTSANASASASASASANLDDPLSFATTFKSFWQTLGLSPLTVHSLKPVAEHLVRQVPLLGHVVAELEMMQEWVGLEEAVRHIGEAATGYFVAGRRSPDQVRQLFSGQLRI